MSKQEAQLLQRKACVSIGWITDCAIHWTRQLLYNYRLGEVVFRLWLNKASDIHGRRWFLTLHTNIHLSRSTAFVSIESRYELIWTRKPCYRKDDRAMRPIYGGPEKFQESSQTPRATFPEICKGLLFRSILRMCIQNLKFVALSVPEITGATQKISAVPRYAHAPFSLKFLKGFCSDGPCEYTCQIWSS